MSSPPPSEPGPNPPDPPKGPWNEQVQHAPVSARIPAHVGRGVLSTGAVVFEGIHEFVIDFALRLAAPHSFVARVVLSHAVFAQYVAALRENLKMYEGKFGPPPALPAPPNVETRGRISELYEQLKLPDELLSGCYANAVMIGHSAGEFWFDFITNFYPRSAVSCRIFLSAQQVPGLLATLDTSYQGYLRKRSGTPPPRPNTPQPEE